MVDQSVVYERLVWPAASQVVEVGKLDKEIRPFQTLKGFFGKVGLLGGRIGSPFASLSGIPGFVSGPDSGSSRVLGFSDHFFRVVGGSAGMYESAPDQQYAKTSNTEREPTGNGQLLREFGHDLLGGEITAGNIAKLVLGFCVGGFGFFWLGGLGVDRLSDPTASVWLPKAVFGAFAT